MYVHFAFQTKSMTNSKLLTLSQLISQFVKPNISIYLGGFAFQEPFAAAYEIIRQKKKALYIIKSSGGLMVDMLIGAGCIMKLFATHVWNSVGPVPAQNFRRVMQGNVKQKLQFEEVSFGVFSSMLFAGAYNLPFIPTTPVGGTGQFKYRTFSGNRKFKTLKNPFGNGTVYAVPPLSPDLGIFHVQKADEQGNAQVRGPLAEMKIAALACKQVLITCEEIVPTKEIRNNPAQTLLPGFRVSAAAHVPFGGHPSDVFGYYHRDIDFYKMYGAVSATENGFVHFLKKWVHGCPTHSEYVNLLGMQTLRNIGAKAWV